MKLLLRPIDAAILIFFRIVVGILMGQELINEIFIGKLHRFSITKIHFNYMLFDWIKPWPYQGMIVHFSVTIFAAFAVAFNYHYKFFSKVLFLGYTLLFLFDQSHYINHIYLYCLISFWMMFLPLDKPQNTRPAWMLYLLLFHMGLAYFFGGIAKLNDDWLNGSPMNLYLSVKQNYLLGDLYVKSWAPYLFSYGGIFFDLLIVPLMIMPGTRLFGFVASIIFHISNVMMFGLATFPWFSILMTSMFFHPSWPRRIPILRKFMPWHLEVAPVYYANKKIVAFISCYILIHLALPLRHYLFYPGNPSWTEEGHMFAWRMMLRSKTGRTDFYVHNKEVGSEKVDLMKHLTKKQIHIMSGRPDLMLQFAHHLRDHYEKAWGTEVSVYASSRIGLNGREPQEMIAFGTDLAKEERSLKPYKWIVPLGKNTLSEWSWIK